MKVTWCPRNLLALSLTALCLVALPNGKAHAIGEAGAQFLKIPMGAKACAMGEAFVGLADDPSGIYWNPAGIARLSSWQFMGMHTLWLEQMSYQHVAVCHTTTLGSIGVSAVYSSSGDIPGYDEQISPTGQYTAYDFVGTVAYARCFGDKFSLGAGAKLIQQKIEKETATGFALDVGAQYENALIEHLRVGFSAQNLGPDVKFIEKSDPLPLALRGGVSYARGPLTFTGDIHKPRFNDLRFHAGGEFIIQDALALRAGYLTRPQQEDAVTAGAGVFWRRLRVEYAFVPYEEINDTHRFAVTLAI